MYSDQVWQKVWNHAYDHVTAQCRRVIADKVWQQTRELNPKQEWYVRLDRLRSSLDEAVILEVRQAREEHDV